MGTALYSLHGPLPCSSSLALTAARGSPPYYHLHIELRKLLWKSQGQEMGKLGLQSGSSEFTSSTVHDPIFIACVLSCFSRVWLFATLWTIVCQAPQSMGFSRQEYWSGLLYLPPGDLQDSGIKPAPLTSPALAGRFFVTSATWEVPQHPLASPI